MLRRLIVLTAVLAALLLPAAAPAAGTVTWGISPASAAGQDARPFIQLLTEPGQEYTDHVAVRNFGHEELTVALYAADAVNTPDGGFDVHAADEPNTLAGAWIALERDRLTLAPRETRVVGFTLDVPDDATPGDHAAGIVASVTRDAEEGLEVENRVGTRVHVRVAGTVAPSVSIEDVDARYTGRSMPFTRGEVEVTYTIANDGNLRLDVRPRLRIGGPLGLGPSTVADEPVVDLLPGGTVRRTATVTGVWPLIRLGIDVDLAAVESAGQDLTTQTTVSTGHTAIWALSLPTLAVLLGALTLIVALALRRARHRRRRPAPADPIDAVAR